jgi:hypothetical protein
MKERTYDNTYSWLLLCRYSMMWLCIFIMVRVFIVCVILCTVFRLIVVLFWVMCVVCVLCLTVVPLPPGENTFEVKINIILYLYLLMYLILSSFILFIYLFIACWRRVWAHFIWNIDHFVRITLSSFVYMKWDLCSEFISVLEMWSVFTAEVALITDTFPATYHLIRKSIISSSQRFAMKTRRLYWSVSLRQFKER